MLRVLGIAGTAKNTGKTTTLLEVLKYFASVGKKTFVTSIGYDGEDFDNITGLPKPRVLVPKDTVVATALPLMQVSPAKFTGLVDTGVRCALGRVFVGRASRDGKVVLAGPTSTPHVLSVLKFAPDDCVVLLDAAFARLSPMTAADALILATGAARSPNSYRIAQEIDIIGEIMSLSDHGSCGASAKTHVNRDSCDKVIRVDGGLFLRGQGREIGWRLRSSSGIRSLIYIDGIVNPAVFDEMLSELEGNPTHSVAFVISHPIMMLLSGDILAWRKVLSRARDMGHLVTLGSKLRLLGVTVSPYRPLYDSLNRKFVAKYVPPRAFLNDIRDLTSVPCTDIIMEGPEILRLWLDSYLKVGERSR